MPHFHAVALAVAKGGLIGSLPVQFARRVGGELGLDIYELPVGHGDMDMGMYWHRRYDRDNGHRWLRAEVAAVLGEKQAGP